MAAAVRSDRRGRRLTYTRSVPALLCSRIPPGRLLSCRASSAASAESCLRGDGASPTVSSAVSSCCVHRDDDTLTGNSPCFSTGTLPACGPASRDHERFMGSFDQWIDKKLLVTGCFRVCVRINCGFSQVIDANQWKPHEAFSPHWCQCSNWKQSFVGGGDEANFPESESGSGPANPHRGRLPFVVTTVRTVGRTHAQSRLLLTRGGGAHKYPRDVTGHVPLRVSCSAT